MSPAPESLHVVIIGAGVGGLALAQGLQKSGVRVTLYERDRTRADVVHGFRLRIRTRGIEALRSCLPPGLFAAFERTCGIAPAENVYFDEQLRPVSGAGAPLDAEVHGDKSVSRITLHQILLAGLGDAIETGKAFIGYEERRDGRVLVRFDDGSTTVCDVLVGADGAESTVRRQLLPDAPFVDTGAQRIAGKIDLTPANRAALARWLYTKTANIRSREGFNLFVTTHLVNQRGVEPGDAAFTGNDGASQSQSGLMFDNTRDYVFWALGTPAGRLPPPELLGQGRQALHRWVQHTLADWHADLRELFRLTDPSTVNATPIRTSLPTAGWATGAVTLLGDAAHSMTYFRALGANAALADARLLCRELAGVKCGKKSLHEALRDYEAQMFETGFAAVLASIESFRALLGEGRPITEWTQVPLELPAPRARRALAPRPGAEHRGLVLNDPRSLELLEQVQRVAASGATALVIGETGTGKELVARQIHDHSGRTGPFVAVNCAAFAESLIDAELFGHETGAFTGASEARAGWFETAHGGTLFLDEIGDMPLNLQVKLLRVLQERQVVRLGGRDARAVDVRVVAATNVDLARAMQDGRFRADLFYRLHVATIRLPPLRERRQDIVPLARHFAEIYRRKLDAPAIVFSADADAALREHDWPGNIRELENVVHYATIVSEDGRIERHHLRLPRRRPDDIHASASAIDLLAQAVQLLLDQQTPNLFEAIEEAVISTAFEHCERNQLRTARELGISRNVLRAQLKRFGQLASTGRVDEGEPAAQVEHVG